MISDVLLIKVKTLTKKMADQIQVTNYTEETGKRLLEMRPLAWASGEVIDGIPNGGRAWLFENEQQLWWMSAPYGGRVSERAPDWLNLYAKNLPQVFIG